MITKYIDNFLTTLAAAVTVGDTSLFMAAADRDKVLEFLPVGAPAGAYGITLSIGTTMTFLVTGAGAAVDELVGECFGPTDPAPATAAAGTAVGCFWRAESAGEYRVRAMAEHLGGATLAVMPGECVTGPVPVDTTITVYVAPTWWPERYNPIELWLENTSTGATPVLSFSDSASTMTFVWAGGSAPAFGAGAGTLHIELVAMGLNLLGRWTAYDTP